MSSSTTNTDTTTTTTTTTNTTEDDVKFDDYSFDMDMDHHYDDDIQSQWTTIQTEITQSQPIISDLQPLQSLTSQYAQSERYLAKLKNLCERYETIRCIRGDGNCFYRAYWYACMEYLISIDQQNEVGSETVEGKRLVNEINESLDYICKFGYSRTAIEDMYDYMKEQVDYVVELSKNKTNQIENHKLLKERMNESSIDMCIISYLRIWTSVYLQTHADDFLPYLAAFSSTHQSNQIYTDMKTFCSSEVEPMDRDVDHIQIIALTSAISLPIRIEYFDQSETAGNTTTYYDMPPPNTVPRAYLLYRPGHYDIIKPHPQKLA